MPSAAIVLQPTSRAPIHDLTPSLRGTAYASSRHAGGVSVSGAPPDRREANGIGLAQLEVSDSNEHRPCSAALSPIAPRGNEHTQGQFSALEWTVVKLAQQEPLKSIRASKCTTRARRLFRWMIGTRPWIPLADDRLDALRCTVVAICHRKSGLRETEQAAFFAAGFSSEQLELLVRTSGSRILDPDAAKFSENLSPMPADRDPANAS